ncbi:MAG: hypothetical protein JSS67_02635 [Bacteroidetes bacterium]|nr:hypothetical protein [Bacteroidota bacterium]
MENKPALTPEESLHIISSMIDNVQKRYSDNGFLYLLWGWVVFFCGIAQFILWHFFHNQNHYLVWSVLWVVLIFEIFYLRKKRVDSNVRSYTGNIIKYVWLSFVLLLMVIFISLSHLDLSIFQTLIVPVMLAMYGLPVFLSGIILRFKPLIFGGIACWILSLIAGYVSYDYQLLFIPAAMVIAWILPGFILKKKFGESSKARIMTD